MSPTSTPFVFSVAISEVFVNTINGNLESKSFRFRLTYQDLNGDISTRDTKNGKWTIVIINEI